MAGKGGKRPGAGRKAKSVEDLQVTFIAKNLPEEKCSEVLNRMIEIALGPDVKAAVSAGTLLLAYALGKPKERLEHSGEDGGPFVLKVVYEQPRTHNPIT